MLNIASENEKLLTSLRDLKLTAGHLAIEDDGMISKFASFFTNKVSAFAVLFNKNSSRMVTINEKDYSQFVTELLKLKKDIEPLISKIKFSDVETMVIPIMLGLRTDLLNASSILAEVISKTEPMLVTALDNIDISISKILSDKHFRTSSRYPNMKHLDDLYTATRTMNKALVELIDGNSVTDKQKVAFLLPNINSLTTIYSNLERVANITTLKNIKAIEGKITKVSERATYLYELLTDESKELELSKAVINGISDELEYSADMVTTMISLIHIYNQVTVTTTTIVEKFKTL